MPSHQFRMEVSALTYSGGIGLHGRSRLLRLQSDERLVAMLRKGNTAAFEVLVARYEARLHAFCRHLLGSREDAEDVMQEVMTAAFNAILADDRPINVRPWLYRIARNRSLNHLRRIQAIGVESMDVHFSDGGASTADKVTEREEFRLLVGDINDLPETQKTALVLREMDALSYEQIAEAMETTVSSVKSLLVRARVSLAEAAEARMLSCDEVRIELAEVAEGLRRRPGALVRRHLRSCKRCTIFRAQLKQTNRALAALFPIGALGLAHKLLFFHLGHSAGAGSGATAAGSGAAGAAGAGAAGAGAAGAGAAGTAVAGSGALVGGGGFVSAGIGAIATKAAAGLAAAALVTGAAVEADHSANPVHHAHHVVVASVPHAVVPAPQAPAAPVATSPEPRSSVVKHAAARPAASHTDAQRQSKNGGAQTPGKSGNATTTATTSTPGATTPTKTAASDKTKPTDPGRTQNQSDATVLPPVTTPVGTPPPPPPPPATVASVPTTTPTGTTTTTPTTGTTTPPGTGTTTTTTPTGTTTTGTGTGTTPTGGQPGTGGGEGGGTGGGRGSGGTGTGGTGGTGGGRGSGGTGTGGTGGTGTGGGTGDTGSGSGTGTGSGGGQTGSGGTGDTGTGASSGSASARTGSGLGSRLVIRHTDR